LHNVEKSLENHGGNFIPFLNFLFNPMKIISLYGGRDKFAAKGEKLVPLPGLPQPRNFFQSFLKIKELYDWHSLCFCKGQPRTKPKP
jgi:hypothetical protein